MRSVSPPAVAAPQPAPVATAEPLGASTIATFCRRNGIGQTLGKKLIATGKLRAVKCAGRTLILATDEKAWLEALPAVKITRPDG